MGYICSIMHKAGFVNILGKPNAGKSTLMNAMLGEKLSIITSKAQTTRHRIMGILNGEDHQVVFSDTPGIIQPHYKLQEKMMNYVEESLTDADIFLFVIDITDKETADTESELYKKVQQRLQESAVPVIIAVNKIDESDQQKLDAIGELLHNKFPKAALVPVSALKKFNTDVLLKLILEHMPESEAYYDKEDISDKPVRFFVSEIIREKILLYYEKEIPYSVEIAVNSFKEADDIIRIQADILVVRDSQKSIIIGKGGMALKRVGTEARLDMEKFLGKKVFLELFVKVKKDWRDSDRDLKNFGY
jgi:GTP-binding protein Era